MEAAAGCALAAATPERRGARRRFAVAPGRGPIFSGGGKPVRALPAGSGLRCRTRRTGRTRGARLGPAPSMICGTRAGAAGIALGARLALSGVRASRLSALRLALLRFTALGFAPFGFAPFGLAPLRLDRVDLLRLTLDRAQHQPARQRGHIDACASALNSGPFSVTRISGRVAFAPSVIVGPGQGQPRVDRCRPRDRRSPRIDEVGALPVARSSGRCAPARR